MSEQLAPTTPIRERLRRIPRLWRRPLVRRGGALVAASAVVALFHWSGGAAGIRDNFEFMGFDAERAVLLTAGIGAALAGVVAVLVGRNRLVAAIAGLVGLALLFGRTFFSETTRAMAGGAIGQFNPAGWAVTVVALAAAGLLLGLAAGVLADEARGGLASSVIGIRDAWRSRDQAAIPWRSAGTAVAVLAAIAIAAPATGQLLNYGPDTLMLSGAAAPIPIVLQDGNPPPVATGGSTATAGPASSALPATPSSRTMPWLAWRPTGTGHVIAETLPGPWTGGTSSNASFWVYLPPGYASGTRHYPVVYEIPWAIDLYDQGASIRPMLDGLMDAGDIPAEIVVFLTSSGGPFVDNECLDSAGHREWFDTFVGTTLVAFMDAQFRTIPDPAARTLLGDSQGGFCAANVLLHHPTVFHQEISFSGYYWAAPILRMTPSAEAAYAGDLALEHANSPALELASIPADLRPDLTFTLVGNPAQSFYGSQMEAFAGMARRLGFRVMILTTVYGHSWPAVRQMLPAALFAVSERQVAEGVF